jgi:hypothetical protein
MTTTAVQTAVKSRLCSMVVTAEKAVGDHDKSAQDGMIQSFNVWIHCPKGSQFNPSESDIIILQRLRSVRLPDTAHSLCLSPKIECGSSIFVV